MKRWMALTVAVVMLIVGGAIYLLFRTKRLVMFHVTDSLGLTDTIDGWRKAAAGISLPEWSVYVLPNALWAGAYVMTTDTILRNHHRTTRLVAAGVIPLLGIGGELMQAAGLIPGTFDWLDIAAYALPYLIYILYMTSTKNRKICN